MATKSARVIPIVADMADSKVLVDRTEGGSPFLWRGETVQIRLLCALNGVALDLTNIASLTIQLKPYADRDADPVMLKTVLAAALDVDATLTQFDAGTHQHATFEFSKVETNLTLGANSAQYWMVIHGETTDNPSKEITYAAGIVTIEEDGAVGGQAAPDLQPVIAIDETDTPYTIPATAVLLLVDCSASAIEAILPASPADGMRLTIKDQGDAGTNAITVTPGAGQLIDGAASLTLETDLDYVTLHWHTATATWWVVARGAGTGDGGASTWPKDAIVLTCPDDSANIRFQSRKAADGTYYLEPDQTPYGGLVWPEEYITLTCPDDSANIRFRSRKAADGTYYLEPDQTPV